MTITELFALVFALLFIVFVLALMPMIVLACYAIISHLLGW